MTRAGGATRSWSDLAACLAASAVALALVWAGSTASAAGSIPTSSEYRNPVHDTDFPDPFVLRDGGRFLAYATQGRAANVQIVVSADLVTWARLGTALPFLPAWSDGHAWAPAVLPVGGRHVLYYTTIERRSGLFCLSAAVADRPEGPFIDSSTGPLLCQRSRGGTIDPSPLVDADGTRWLLFKSDGIEGQEPTRLWSQRLGPDGLSLVGPRHQLLVTDRPWEEPVIENPAMTRADGSYFLLYSANRWYSADYAVGWARCDSPAGPCHKPDAGPLIASTEHALGPGGADFFTGPYGGHWVGYHAWKPPHTEYPWGERSLRIDKIRFAQGRPWIDAPTTTPVSFSFTPGPPPPSSSEPGPPAPPAEPAPAPMPPPAPDPSPPGPSGAPAPDGVPADGVPAAGAGPAPPAPIAVPAPAPAAPVAPAPAVVAPRPDAVDRPVRALTELSGGPGPAAATGEVGTATPGSHRGLLSIVALFAVVAAATLRFRAWQRQRGWTVGSRS